MPEFIEYITTPADYDHARA